jgi:homogentisate phytyltransferase / homogentisate geranylgeranyltransferase
MPMNPSLLPPVRTTPSEWLSAFWKFSRPHTIIGTSLSVLGLYILTIALSSHPGATGWSWSNLANLGLTWLACLGGNIYIVGLNQLTDVEIDRINKPDLPLASGEFTRPVAKTIVGVMGVLALTLAICQGPFLLATVGLSLVIGTAYSLPPVRLKRFPFWAALCILGVRGAIVNLGLFLHYQNYQTVGQRLTGDVGLTSSSLASWSQRFGQLQVTSLSQVPPEVWALTLFVLVFTFAIAIFKDIPDLEGDRQYHISTLTVRLGGQAVFNLALAVLTVCYLGMILVTLVWLKSVQPIVLMGSQVFALSVLLWQSRRVDLSQRSEIANYYQLIWKCFFLEYLIFPLACFFRAY